MIGVTFYLEFPDLKTKRKSGKEHTGHSGNVLAVWKDQWWHGGSGVEYSGYGAVHFHPNSVCGSTNVSDRYIRENCKRIPEALARKIHPNLFHAMDDVEITLNKVLYSGDLDVDEKGRNKATVWSGDQRIGSFTFKDGESLAEKLENYITKKIGKI